jgi:hypothetical protein
MFSSNTTQVAGISGSFNYIEDVFSTYLYTGASAGNDTTFINNIDLTTKGGMVWIKQRDTIGVNPTSSGYAPGNHYIFDTARGNQNALCPSAAVGQDSSFGAGYFNFLTNGFNTGNGGNGYTNVTGSTFASWTFRKQAKFFDVVTYTGDGTSARAVNHSLGSVPGFVIVKATSTAGHWWVVARNSSGTYYRSDTPSANQTSGLNSDRPMGGPYDLAGFGYLTTTQFTPQTITGGVVGDGNANGVPYVAYLFAHNAGGFGLTNTDNVISCGSYTGNASLSGPVVTLGYEPQWVLIKRTDSTGNWLLQDNMRSLSHTNTDMLFPNLSNNATTGAYPSVVPTATGFYIGDNGTNYNASGGTYIYIAIRRGPMKVPTLGTTVYNAIARTGTGSTNTVVTGVGFSPSLVWVKSRTSTTYFHQLYDKLRGVTKVLNSNSTQAENTDTAALTAFGNDGFKVETGLGINQSSMTFVNWCFQRAPGFFDIVCYTGNESTITNLNHNLGVLPELIIIKSRTQGPDGDFAWLGWWALASKVGGSYRFGPAGNSGLNNTGSGSDSSIVMGPPNFTTTTFNPYYVTQQSGNIGIAGNMLAEKYVAYLYATCPGVSKVGTYTGTATTLQVPCGFTAGARFVLIKRASGGAGAWFVWDSTRGITSGNDPYLTLNSIDAEETTTDYIDPYSAGFEISSSAPLAINASGSVYIFLAIA